MIQSNGGEGRCKKTLRRIAFDSLESLLVHGGVTGISQSVHQENFSLLTQAHNVTDKNVVH